MSVESGARWGLVSIIKVVASGIACSAVVVGRSVVSDSLQPHGLQHTRLPSPSSSPGLVLELATPWTAAHQASQSFLISWACLRAAFNPAPQLRPPRAPQGPSCGTENCSGPQTTFCSIRPVLLCLFRIFCSHLSNRTVTPKDPGVLSSTPPALHLLALLSEGIKRSYWTNPEGMRPRAGQQQWALALQRLAQLYVFILLVGV